MIKTKSLTHTVTTATGNLTILRDINLSIEEGQTLAIVGASGSGKSTLLGMLAGLDLPSSGEVQVNGEDITQLNEEQRALMRSKYVGFVFQNFQLLPSLTALENVSLAMELKDDPEAKAKALEFLGRVGLGSRSGHYPHQLSGGEQQRVAIARAFACEAPIIFADEPTGNLDTKTGEAITELLFKLNQENNTTLILVTHSPALASRCDRQVEMSSGEISELAKGKAA